MLPRRATYHGDIGITFDSQYIWRGFEVFGKQSAISPFVDLDLFGTGFGVDVIAHRANSDGYENSERWDYSLYYQNMLFADDAFATSYKLSYVYYNYPDMRAHGAYVSLAQPGSVDLQEINALLAWPNITGVKGLVPAYCIVKLWPSSSDTMVGDRNVNHGSASGFAHIFMLNYALPIPGLTAESPEQVFNFHTELVYNDGVDPRPNGGYKSSDWTDFVMGVSTDVKLGSGLVFTPGVYHQITMEDNPSTGVAPDHSITWASLTLKYQF